MKIYFCLFLCIFFLTSIPVCSSNNISEIDFEIIYIKHSIFLHRFSELLNILIAQRIHLSGQKSAVDYESRSVYHSGVVTKHENHSVCNITQTCKSAQWDSSHYGSRFFWIRPRDFSHTGQHHSWIYVIGTDTVFAQFDCHRSSYLIHGSFRRTICRMIGYGSLRYVYNRSFDASINHPCSVTSKNDSITATPALLTKPCTGPMSYIFLYVSSQFETSQNICLQHPLPSLPPRKQMNPNLPIALAMNCSIINVYLSLKDIRIMAGVLKFEPHFKIYQKLESE
ncbi:hypothetical protein AGLY_014643 [Aphis glycines]|uniref:Uncharacterized protein n=1 Tax=Aphis glycines TaxID=307491 RepID=A0A6G0T1T5_APHGL|nr:hypothetical protein AGLY_014643 [Aphis glycines]